MYTQIIIINKFTQTYTIHNVYRYRLCKWYSWFEMTTSNKVISALLCTRSSQLLHNTIIDIFNWVDMHARPVWRWWKWTHNLNYLYMYIKIKSISLHTNTAKQLVNIKWVCVHEIIYWVNIKTSYFVVYLQKHFSLLTIKSINLNYEIKFVFYVFLKS